MHAASLVKFLAAAIVAAGPAAAELAMTSPIGSTTCSGGQTCQIAWNDNGRNNITLAQQGECTVALYTGNAQQQTFLQPIVFPQTINVATTSAVEFTVDANIGPNSDQYFIRIESKNFTQPGSTKPYISFSAKFKLDNMRGTFNASVEAQLAGVTSAGGATSTSGPSGTTSRTTSSTRPTGSSSTTNSNNTGAASSNTVASSFVAAGAFVAAGVVALF